MTHASTGSRRKAPADPASVARSILLAAALLSALMVPPRAAAEMAVPVFGSGPIPEQHFTSWSLFLMCNPAWLAKRKSAQLEEVFSAYEAFTMTTGRSHAGVWFVKPESARNRASWSDPAHLDLDRNAAYCRRFGLDGSDGPHILVTATHPDRLPDDIFASSARRGSALVLVALGDSEPDQIVRLLGKLNDQVLSERLSQADIDKAHYWQAWERILERGCKFFDKVKFTLSAPVFNIEKTGLCR